MIVLTPHAYTFSKGHYITTFQGEMVGTIKFPRKGSKRGVELDHWVSSQPKSVLVEGREKLEAYLNAGGHPKDSFKKLGEK